VGAIIKERQIKNWGNFKKILSWFKEVVLSWGHFYCKKRPVGKKAKKGKKTSTQKK